MSISDYYCRILLEPIIRGESACFYWYPGAGKTTIVDQVFQQKFLKANLEEGLFARIHLIKIICSLAEEYTANSVLITVSSEGKSGLARVISEEAMKGKEVVMVIDRLEVLPRDEIKRLILALSDVRSVAPGRVRIIINSTQKPIIAELAGEDARIASLLQIQKIIPLLDPRMVEEFINEYAEQMNISLGKDRMEKVIKFTGGILSLTKEVVRSGQDSLFFKTKAAAIWSRLPPQYHSGAHPDLREFHADKLEIYKFNKYRFNTVLDLIAMNLSKNELKVYEYLKAHPGKTIIKEIIAELIWESQSEEKYSVWAIDQFISRFRKNLAKSGVRPDMLKTVKGKGYVWQE